MRRNVRVGTFGDVNPLDHDGGVSYLDPYGYLVLCAVETLDHGDGCRLVGLRADFGPLHALTGDPSSVGDNPFHPTMDWWPDLTAVERYTGADRGTLAQALTGGRTRVAALAIGEGDPLAWTVESARRALPALLDIIGYYGWAEFGDKPATLTRTEARRWLRVPRLTD